MTYDFIGERLYKVKTLLQEGKYYQAFQNLMAIVKIVSPMSKDWHSLVELAKKIIEKIENPAEKALALLDLSEKIRPVNYDEYRELVSRARELLVLISDPKLAREIQDRLERSLPAARQLTASSHAAIRARLLELKSRLTADPRLASRLESFLMEYENSLSDSDKKELHSLLKKYPPELRVEAEVINSNLLFFPSNLEFKVKLTNVGFRSAKDVRIILKLNTNSYIDEQSIDPISGSTLKLSPNESRDIYIRVPVKRPGKYDVYLGAEYHDIFGEIYRSTPIQVLKDLEVIIPSVHEALQRGSVDEFNKTRINLVTSIQEVIGEYIKLYNSMIEDKNSRDDKVSRDELQGELSKLIGKLNEEFLKRLHDVVNSYKLNLRSCVQINDLYERIIREVESKISTLTKLDKEKNLLDKKLLFKTNLPHKEVYNSLKELLVQFIKILWIEDSKNVEDLLNKLKSEGFQKDKFKNIELNILLLVASMSSNEIEKSIMQYRLINALLSDEKLIKTHREQLTKTIDSITNKISEQRVEYKC